jgi:hypothetical protein
MVERVAATDDGSEGGGGMKKPFDKHEYRHHPERYRSVFHRAVAPHISVLVNGMYWDHRYVDSARHKTHLARTACLWCACVAPCMRPSIHPSIQPASQPAIFRPVDTRHTASTTFDAAAAADDDDDDDDDGVSGSDAQF